MHAAVHAAGPDDTEELRAEILDRGDTMKGTAVDDKGGSRTERSLAPSASGARDMSRFAVPRQNASSSLFGFVTHSITASCCSVSAIPTRWTSMTSNEGGVAVTRAQPRFRAQAPSQTA